MIVRPFMFAIGLWFEMLGAERVFEPGLFVGGIIMGMIGALLIAFSMWVSPRRR